MPRTVRVRAPDSVHHVLNRGNSRSRIFHKAPDYQAFVNLLGEAAVRFRTRLLAYCLMPNHWHLVLWPRLGSEIPAYMQWLTNAHVRRYHQHYGSTGTGHLYQGRYADFLVEHDRYLLAVLRYVEANPVRAGLVTRAEHWPWSSLTRACAQDGTPLISEWPVARPDSWAEFVNSGVPRRELAELRLAARRGRPFGSPEWQSQTTSRYGLEFTLRPVGRPSKAGRHGGRGPADGRARPVATSGGEAKS